MAEAKSTSVYVMFDPGRGRSYTFERIYNQELINLELRDEQDRPLCSGVFSVEQLRSKRTVQLDEQVAGSVEVDIEVSVGGRPLPTFAVDAMPEALAKEPSTFREAVCDHLGVHSPVYVAVEGSQAAFLINARPGKGWDGR
jgi:hypothetical protein